MKRQAGFWLLLGCLILSGCRRAATAQPAKPAPPTVDSAARPQPTVCVAENVSRTALLQKAGSPTPQTHHSPTPKR